MSSTLMKYDTGLNGARSRLRILGLSIAIGFLLIAISLVYWTILRGSSILARDDNPRLVEQELNIRRGTILDTNSIILAETQGSPGDLKRVYPLPESGPAVGYYSFRHGTAGIEEGMDSVLRGEGDEPWSSWWHHEVLHEEVIGQDIRLTLDARWQETADELMGDMQGSVILFSIPDYAIRAMTSKPGYDPNQLDEEFETLTQDERAPLVNRATQGQYQPGQTFVPFLLADALAQGLISLDAVVEDVGKDVAINGYMIGCEDQPERETDWKTILQKRCPYPITQLAQLMGENGVLAVYESFGLFEPPELSIATESGEQQPISSLALAGIGQDEQTVSPLQLARGYAALTNAGQLPQFQLNSAAQNDSGFWEPAINNDLPRRIIPADVAEDILAALPVNQGFSEHSVLVLSGPEGSTNSWYLGLAPAGAPRYGVVVITEDTGGQHTADQVGQLLLKQVLGGE